jgi:hypothetical protein
MRLGQSDDSVHLMTTMNRIDIEQDAPALYRAYCRLDTAVGQSALPRPLA